MKDFFNELFIKVAMEFPDGSREKYTMRLTPELLNKPPEVTARELAKFIEIEVTKKLNANLEAAKAQNVKITKA